MTHTLPPMSGLSGASSAAPALPLGPRRGRLHAAIVTVRPRQWVKNLLVIAAAGAAGALGHDDVPGRVGLACVAFCLISAGIYAINDVSDIAEDRRHPRKRFRPVAAGELDRLDAVLLGCAWLLGGLLLCFEIRALLGVVGLAYVALTLSYTLALAAHHRAGHHRHRRRLRTPGIGRRRRGSGRAVALVRVGVTCVALFVAAGKRYAELMRRTRASRVDTSAQAGGRHVLRRYSPSSLRILLIGSGAGALFAYCVWAFELLDVDGVPWRLLTVIPFTAACCARAACRAGRARHRKTSPCATAGSRSPPSSG